MTTAEFGFTAWGADVVRIAEPINATTPNALAPRARSIARNGGVSLEIDRRQVTAHVHRGAEASVAHLEIAAMDPDVVAAIREVMGPRGEPDDATHAALGERGLRPAITLEAADCSCRARTTMCVHVLAALYALASLVDHQPSTLLTIQSLDDAPDRPAPTGSGPDGSADDTAADRPVRRWVRLAALDFADYYAVRATGVAGDGSPA